VRAILSEICSGRRSASGRRNRPMNFMVLIIVMRFFAESPDRPAQGIRYRAGRSGNDRLRSHLIMRVNAATPRGEGRTELRVYA
jgi:hypothetical protein